MKRDDEGSSIQEREGPNNNKMNHSTSTGKGYDDTEGGTRMVITVPLFLQRGKTDQERIFCKFRLDLLLLLICLV